MVGDWCRDVRTISRARTTRRRGDTRLFRTLSIATKYRRLRKRDRDTSVEKRNANLDTVSLGAGAGGVRPRRRRVSLSLSLFAHGRTRESLETLFAAAASNLRRQVPGRPAAVTHESASAQRHLQKRPLQSERERERERGLFRFLRFVAFCAFARDRRRPRYFRRPRKRELEDRRKKHARSNITHPQRTSFWLLRVCVCARVRVRRKGAFLSLLLS